QGRPGGRPRVVGADKLAAARARRAHGESPTQIARALGVSRATVYRSLSHAHPDDTHLDGTPQGSRASTVHHGGPASTSLWAPERRAVGATPGACGQGTPRST